MARKRAIYGYTIQSVILFNMLAFPLKYFVWHMALSHDKNVCLLNKTHLLYRFRDMNRKMYFL